MLFIRYCPHQGINAECQVISRRLIIFLNTISFHESGSSFLLRVKTYARNLGSTLWPALISHSSQYNLICSKPIVPILAVEISSVIFVRSFTVNLLKFADTSTPC